MLSPNPIILSPAQDRTVENVPRSRPGQTGVQDTEAEMLRAGSQVNGGRHQLTVGRCGTRWMPAFWTGLRNKYIAEALDSVQLSRSGSAGYMSTPEPGGFGLFAVGVNNART